MRYLKTGRRPKNATKVVKDKARTKMAICLTRPIASGIRRGFFTRVRPFGPGVPLVMCEAKEQDRSGNKVGLLRGITA